MRAIIRYTMITAFRDLLFLGLFGLVIMAVLISNFLGDTALSEQDQMTIAYMSSSIRFIITIGLILFICFHVKRLFDSREIEVILSRTISRTSFILSYWVSFTLLAIILVLSASFILLVLNQADSVGLIYWTMTLCLESAIITSFALLASLILKSAVASTLVVFCFYFLARMMGYFTASLKFMLYFPSELGQVLDWSSAWILKIISIIVPRFDLSAKSGWLIYGIEKTYDYWVFPAQAAIYIPFILLMSLFDFNRKEF